MDPPNYNFSVHLTLEEENARPEKGKFFSLKLFSLGNRFPNLHK